MRPFGASEKHLKIYLDKANNMKEVKQTKAQLEKRRDEINRQLNGVDKDLQFELERNPEDQAIQLEQDEVLTSMHTNLQKELNDIEDKLLEFENE